MRARLVNLYRHFFPHPAAIARRERRRVAMEADQARRAEQAAAFRPLRDSITAQLRTEIEQASQP